MQPSPVPSPEPVHVLEDSFDVLDVDDNTSLHHRHGEVKVPR